MRKKFFMPLLLVLIIPISFAVSIDMKESYEKGETIIAEIKGNFVKLLTKEQVDLKRGHVSVPFEYELKKLGERYFLWMIAPLNENNYTLEIKNIVTMESGSLKTIDFKQNFSVQSNLTDYNIKPGFFLGNEYSSLEIKSFKDDAFKISLDYPEEKEIEIKPGITLISFPKQKSNETIIKFIKIGKYNVPVYLKAEQMNTSRPIQEKMIFEVIPQEIKTVILFGKEIEFPFQITNKGNTSSDMVEIDFNEHLFSIKNMTGKRLEKEGFIQFDLVFSGNVNEDEKEIYEILSITIGDSIVKVPIMIEFTKDENKTEIPDYIENYKKLEYCSLLNGIICTAGKTCEGEIKNSLDGACCIGKCTSSSNGGSNAWLGYVIVGILIVILVIIFLKYRKTKGVSEFDKRVKEGERKLRI